MIVIVCGGRNYHNVAFLEKALDRVLEKHPDLKIKHGAAPGADTIAWARRRGVEAFPADWDRLGRRALRNLRMIDSGADAVVAVRGDAGTAGGWQTWPASRSGTCA